MGVPVMLRDVEQPEKELLVISQSALLVGSDEARLGGIISELQGMGYEAFHAADANQAREALQTTRFQLLLCCEPGALAGLRAASGSTAGECWFVAVYANDSDGEPVVRVSSGGAGEVGADAIVEGNLNRGRWSEILKKFTGEKSALAGDPPRHESLPSFDREAFAHQMNDDQEMMAEIIGLYISETARQMRDLKDLIERGESVATRKLAHTLKGSFGAVCARRAGALAREIELAAAESNFSRASVLFESLGEAVSDGQVEMEALVSS